MKKLIKFYVSKVVYFQMVAQEKPVKLRIIGPNINMFIDWFRNNNEYKDKFYLERAKRELRDVLWTCLIDLKDGQRYEFVFDKESSILGRMDKKETCFSLHGTQKEEIVKEDINIFCQIHSEFAYESAIKK